MLLFLQPLHLMQEETKQKAMKSQNKKPKVLTLSQLYEIMFNYEGRNPQNTSIENNSVQLF